MILAHERLSSTPIAMGFGELIIDLNSRFFGESIVFGSGVMTHEIEVPDDPFLIGFGLHVQASVHFPSATSFGDFKTARRVQMCNAEHVRIGCHHEEEHEE